MLATRHLRHLTLTQGSAHGRAPHLNAASGLVKVGSTLYVVGDDENHLGVFPSHGISPGHLVRLFEGELPVHHHARKRHKRDLEALCLLPPTEAWPQGALFALGSGSLDLRNLGALWPLTREGDLEGQPAVITLKSLYGALENEVGGKLNVEGACVQGDRLWLLQRGNSKGATDAIAFLQWNVVAKELSRGGLSTAGLTSVRPVRLGDIQGVPLTFTDASPLPDGRVVFSAAAEATEDSYLDGPCKGSAVGLLSAEGEPLRLERLNGEHKVEGVHAEMGVSGGVELLLVADADDEAVASPLMAAVL